MSNQIEDEENLKSKLEYLNLDLNNIPNWIKDYSNIDYRPQKNYDENTYKIYKYIPISKIEILLTPTNRLNSIKEKFSKAAPLYSYINPKDESDIIRHTTFLRMLKSVKIEEIEEIEEQQKAFNKTTPFKVKFFENYLWQIYYSDIDNKYFMLVTTEDIEYGSFFYLLKKKNECIEKKKEELIYVPICYEQYSEEYLKASEIKDLEKYLWLFAKDWPIVYEVRDRKNILSIQIVGTIDCFENIKSDYRIKLSNKEDAIKFYKFLKAIFILQTELPHHFQFDAKISKTEGLEFEYKGKKISYEELATNINDIYEEAQKQIENLKVENEELSKQLNELQSKKQEQEREYLQKERQIATYLECRKTFLGRVKYFILNKRSKKRPKEEKKDIITEIVRNAKLPIKEMVEKKVYNIEDILEIYKNLDEILVIIRNLKLDVQALNNKVESMELKIKNATLYLDEIDSHEKNIFEFWKFTNKDENLMLNQGVQEETVTNKKIEKTFKYEDDFEDLGKQADKDQERYLTKEQKDAMFIASTELLDILNNIKLKKDTDIINERLTDLKKELEEDRILLEENTDIFGNLEDDTTKAKILAGKKHRENKKNKLQTINMSKETTPEEFKEKMTSELKTLEEVLENSKAKTDHPVYIATTKKIEAVGFQTVYINPEEAIHTIEDETQMNLYKINLKKDMPILYFSNCIYYDNIHKTLPEGMNLGSKCLIDLANYEFEQIDKNYFRINEEIDEKNVITKRITVYTYNVKIKKEN